MLHSLKLSSMVDWQSSFVLTLMLLQVEIILYKPYFSSILHSFYCFSMPTWCCMTASFHWGCIIFFISNNLSKFLGKLLRFFPLHPVVDSVWMLSYLTLFNSYCILPSISSHFDSFIKRIQNLVLGHSLTLNYDLASECYLCLWSPTKIF